MSGDLIMFGEISKVEDSNIKPYWQRMVLNFIGQDASTLEQIGKDIDQK